MMAIFVHRLVGASMLDSATYEDVERDRGATLQALAVVVLASLAAGVGARGASGARPALEFFLVGTVLSLATWAAFAALTFQVGSRLLPESGTRADAGELLRTLGFAAAPGLLQVFAIFSGMTLPIFTVAAVWTLVASVVAVRQALDYSSTWRALAVCALASLLALLITAMFGAIVAAASLG
jgi:Yip1 domain